jgi:[acyl-carrier-protein] S-malonyltransferase
MKAVLFPGQGSQYVGMGLDFYNKFDLVKKNFDLADKTLGYSLSNIIFNGPEKVLQLTENTQPAILIVGVSIFNVLNKNLNLNSARFFAGHSLGEYTALVCAGALTIEQAVYLLHERGKLMQAAVPPNQGSMIAILGMTIDEIQNEMYSLPKNEICEIANDNCNGQVVVSGETNTLQTLYQNLKKKKKRGIMLPVSAPFHCSMMKSAAEKMKNKINKTNFTDFRPAVVSNVTAKEELDTNLIKSLLVEQITSRVRWRESVNYMIKSGVTDFLEIGPGKVLSGLVKKINKDVKISNINTLDNLKND